MVGSMDMQTMLGVQGDGLKGQYSNETTHFVAWPDSENNQSFP